MVKPASPPPLVLTVALFVSVVALFFAHLMLIVDAPFIVACLGVVSAVASAMLLFVGVVVPIVTSAPP